MNVLKPVCGSVSPQLKPSHPGHVNDLEMIEEVKESSTTQMMSYVKTPEKKATSAFGNYKISRAQVTTGSSFRNYKFKEVQPQSAFSGPPLSMADEETPKYPETNVSMSMMTNHNEKQPLKKKQKA